MTKIYKISLILMILFSSSLVFAQKTFFTDLSESEAKSTSGTRVIIPQKYRTISLDKEGITNFLGGLPSEKNVLNRKSAPVLELPMPDGRTARFNVWESSIQEPALEAKFPEIKTFAGQGIDDPYATIRFDYTPRGLHAQVLTVNGTYYLDPLGMSSTTNYISYFRTDLIKSQSWTCDVTDIAANAGRPNLTAAACLGTSLKTYRLAVANTGEYAQAPGINAGTNPVLLHAAIVTSVNRIVGVYEKEVAIRMVLVGNNNLVEFLDASTDPFNGNNNANVLINESQTVIDANILSANYDIGHTFSTGGGGLAQLNSPCTGSKARGITGSPSPTGDAYDIDYVAHEVGHQFGGNHTMAGCGSSPNSTKYEVGSGTTIQAYAGICGAENIQPNSDPFFHAISFDEISNFITLGAGNTCGVSTATGNNLPVIAPLTGGQTIPIGTPFTLSGTATDADGDALTYNWEQWDFSGTATWNAGATASPNNSVPLFKSRIPKTTGIRTFPDIAVIRANYPASPAAAMGGLKGETLSPVARTMKFKLTVRDNRAGGGGVVSAGAGGCQSTTVFELNVAGTSPFTVAVPNGGESYSGGSSQNITWNVVGTNEAPFNVTNVRITYSTDGGLTYPQTLSATTLNDGSEILVIPAGVTTTARVRVEAIGNIFFDISNANFSVTAPLAEFNFVPSAPTILGCGVTSAAVTIATTATGGFVTPIVLTSTGAPTGTTLTFSPNPLTPGNSTIATLNGTSSLAPGTYTINVTGTAGTVIKTTTISFVVPVLAATINTQPVAQTVCAPGNASFSVAASGLGLTYQWQVSTNGGTSYTDILGATAATYSFSTTPALNNNRYRVNVFSTCSPTTPAVSNAVILTVNTPATITAQPIAQSGCSLISYTFSVTATSGTNAPTYQWQVSTDGGLTFNNIPGETNSTLTLNNVGVNMSGNLYRVVVSSIGCNSVISNAALLKVGNKPTVVLTAPATSSNNPAVNSTLFATVSPAGGNILYTWRRNGLIIPNTLGSTSIPLNVDDQAVYSVRIIDVTTGCQSDSSTLTTSARTSDNLLLNKVFIYPNPVRTMMQVRFNNSTSINRGTMLNIYDEKGTRVLSKAYAIAGTFGRMDVDMSGMQNGTYMVYIMDNSGKKLGGSKVVKVN